MSLTLSLSFFLAPCGSHLASLPPAGCKTGLSGFVTACVVGLVLVAFTPVFERLPLNVMGAIVISAVSGLFEYKQALHLFKVSYLCALPLPLFEYQQAVSTHTRYCCQHSLAT